MITPQDASSDKAVLAPGRESDVLSRGAQCLAAFTAFFAKHPPVQLGSLRSEHLEEYDVASLREFVLRSGYSAGDIRDALGTLPKEDDRRASLVLSLAWTTLNEGSRDWLQEAALDLPDESRQFSLGAVGTPFAALHAARLAGDDQLVMSAAKKLWMKYLDTPPPRGFLDEGLWLALKSAERAPSDADTQAFLEQLESNAPGKMRDQVCRLLASQGEMSEGFRLIDAARSGDGMARQALVGLKHDAFIPALAELVTSRGTGIYDEKLGQSAVHALLSMGSEDAVGRVKGALAAGDDRVRQRVATGIGSLADPAAIGNLARLEAGESAESEIAEASARIRADLVERVRQGRFSEPDRQGAKESLRAAFEAAPAQGAFAQSLASQFVSLASRDDLPEIEILAQRLGPAAPAEVLEAMQQFREE